MLAVSLVAVALVSVTVFAGVAVGSIFTFDVAEDSIQSGDDLTFDFYDDEADDGDEIFVVIDEDGDEEFDLGERNISISSTDPGGDVAGTFPGSETAGLNGTYTLFSIESNSLSAGQNLSSDTFENDDQVTIDGITPYVSEVTLSNPSGQDVNVSFTTDERLNATTVDLSGAESASFGLADFTETNASGTYTYALTYAGNSDGDYTAEVLLATDAAGNDAVDNQTSAELSDSVSVDTVAPEITGVEAEVGDDTVAVTFDEGVENASGGALAAANFTYGNAESGGATDVTAVNHVAGDATATLTLDAAVTRTDLGNDTVAAAAGAITDGAGNDAPTDGVALADTTDPSAPVGATAGVINASNEAGYDLTVDLPDDHEAGTVAVSLSNGGTVTASRYVASEDDGDADPETVSFTGVDVSSLDDGSVSVDATLTDDGGNDATGTGLASPEKDTDRPGVADATITNATIGTEDAGTEQTVTVSFDEDVDTDVAPNVTIIDLNRTYDVTGNFDDTRTWTGTVTILDDNEAANATIRVADAVDLAGNAQSNPDDSNTFEVDTRGPIAPVDTIAGNVTASNDTTYAATVDLVDGSTADKVAVRVSDGTANVTANASTGGADRVTVSGIDVSSLDDGELTVTSRALDEEFQNAEGFVEPVTVTKDTDRPGVDSVSVGDGTINDGDAGTERAVTVTFDEDVNTGVGPTVTLTGLADGNVMATGSFADAQTWTGTVTVPDDDEETNATVEVAGVEDPVGNRQTPSPDTSGSVTVDTLTPTVSGLSLTHDGTGTVTVSFDSDEELVDRSVTLDTPNGTETLNPTPNDESATYTYTATRDGADGDYTATLDAAADAAGNDGATGQTANVTVDTTPPEFSGASPTDETVTTDQPEITLDVTDETRGVSASSIAVTVEDADAGDGPELDAASPSAAGVSYDGTTLAVNATEAGVSLTDGTVTVTVAAADDAGNGGQTTFSFDVDTTPPQFSDAAPADETVTDNTSTVSATVTDATAGVDASTLAVTLSNETDAFLSDAGTGTDGVSYEGTTLTVDPAGAGVPTLPNGSVDVTLTADDAAGNTATTSFSFTVDTPPTITGFSADDTDDSDRNATVSFRSTDELDALSVSVSGAETATLSLADFAATPDGSGFDYAATYEGDTDGTYDFALDTASDGVTDGAAGQSASVLVDEAAPDVTVDAPNGDGRYRGGETLAVEWTATDDVTVTDDVLVEYSTDNGSTWSTVASGLTDDGSYDWTVPNVDTTDALVRVNATDSSSNTGSDVSDATFEVDSTSPTVESFSVSNPSGQNVTVAVETDEALGALSVDVSGATTRTLSLVNFTATGAGPYTYEATFNDSTEGTYDATLDTAADAAGNDGASAETDEIEVDTVTPTISDVSVANPSGQTVNVSFDSSERLASTDVKLETPTKTTTLSSLTETGSGPYTYYATYDEGTDGRYNVTLTAADDGLGNDGADGQTDTVVVDTTPPSLSNVSVTNPSGRQVRVHFDADEPIDEVAVDFSGPETASVSTDNPTVVDGSYVVTYTGNTDGEYTATVTRAADRFGNDAATRSGTVSVTTAAPIISGFAASNPSGQNVTVTFGSDEPLANVTVELSGAESATLTEAEFATGGNTYTATYEGSSNGTYTAVLRTAADADGDDGASGQTNSVTVGSSDGGAAEPNVSSFSATSPGDGLLRVSFESTADLDDVGVAVTGPDATTITRDAFTASNGTYTGTVAVDAGGDYTAVLFRAADAAGTDGSDGQSATATVGSESGSGGSTGAESVDGGSTGGGSGHDGGFERAGTGPSVSVSPTGPTAAAVTVENVAVGDSVDIGLENATSGSVAVTDLSVSAAASTDYSLSVSASPAADSGTPAFDGRAVGYLTVDHSMSDDAVGGATVRVRVDADRFEDTAVDPDATAVYRHHDGEWTRLHTTVASRDDDSFLLEAETPGFSTFAVGTANADAVRVAGASLSESTVSAGEPVTVSATLVNKAGWRVEDGFSVVADGSGVVATRSVSLPAGSTVTTAVDIAFDAPGDYRLVVADTSAGTLAVSAADGDSGDSAGAEGSPPVDDAGTDDDRADSSGSTDSQSGDAATDDSTTETDATGSSAESVPGFGLPAAVAAIAAFAALVGRRRSP